MEILLWLVFPAVMTVLAMLWAAWAGRPQRSAGERRSAADDRRFAAAVLKPHPARNKRVAAPAVDRASGVAVRRTRPTGVTSPRR